MKKKTASPPLVKDLTTTAATGGTIYEVLTRLAVVSKTH